MSVRGPGWTDASASAFDKHAAPTTTLSTSFHTDLTVVPCWEGCAATRDRGLQGQEYWGRVYRGRGNLGVAMWLIWGTVLEA